MTESVEELGKRVLDRINPERLIDLAMGLVDVASPTGYEEGAARFVEGFLQEHGIRAFLQRIEPGRANVVGRLPGSGGGPSLMFNSHLDTSFSGTDADLPVLGEISEAGLPRAVLRDDHIFGLGINNDKGPMAAFIEAAIALKESGVPLRGDLILAGVAGEVGRGGMDERQGPETRSKGIGTRHLLSRGVLSDYALVAEPSRFTATWCLPGVVYVRFTVRGRPLYTPFTERAERPSESENAIIRMMEVIRHLEDWGRRFEASHRYRFRGGTIVPKVSIGAIEGGLPTKPNYQPGICRIYVDIRIPPHLAPLEVLRDVETWLRQRVPDVEMEPFLTERGYEGRGYEPVWNALNEAHREVFGADMEPISEPATSMWNDVNIYHERGIPALKYGPPTIRYGRRREEALAVADLVNAARVYALTALRVVNGPRS